MTSFLLSCFVLAFLTHVQARFEPSCPVIFDGRVPSTADVALFDRNETPFGGYRGSEQKWSSLISFPPQVPPALFDYESGAKPMSIAVDQDSVVLPANKQVETGYRKTALTFKRNTGSDESGRGVSSQMNCFLVD